jgi:hypothetical protein
MGGAQTASEEDLEGDLIFTMDRRGEASVVSVPELSGAAVSIFSPLSSFNFTSIAHEFFPGLPGRAVGPGDTWTDTLSYETSLPGGDLSMISVARYTLEGDTIVDGISLLHIAAELEVEQETRTAMEGMEMLGSMSGEVQGLYLWDPVRACLVGSESTAELTGTVELPTLGMPAMPFRVRVSGHAQLQGD